MSKVVWCVTSFIYRKLGPRRAWMLAMSPFVVGLFRLVIQHVGKKYLVARTKYGFLIKLKIADYLIAGHFHLGETNPYETKILRTILKPGDIFIDVGAHMGWFSLNGSQVVGEKGKVFAFEPNPSVARWLWKNCLLNHFTNVVIESAAVSDKNKRTAFWIGKSDALGSLRRNNAAGDTKSGVKKISVASVTLDTFSMRNKLTKVKFVKIDAEGADLEVLKGAKQMLKRFGPYLMVEVFGLTWETDKKRHEKILSYLVNLGYHPYELVEAGLQRFHPASGQSQLINLFFAKDERELKRLNLLVI